MIDRHHLLECILWPNGDGTFRKIVNTQKRLDKLGIYNEWKLVIPIEHGTHMSMHRHFKKGTEYELKFYGKKNGMYGRNGNKNPMYGNGHLIVGDKNSHWKGEKATASGMYKRAKKLYKSGQLTEQEFQPFRDAVAEYNRQKRKKAI